MGRGERACVLSCHDVLCSAHLEPPARMLHNIVVRVACVAIGSIFTLTRSLFHGSRILFFFVFRCAGSSVAPVSQHRAAIAATLDFQHIFLCALL